MGGAHGLRQRLLLITTPLELVPHAAARADQWRDAQPFSMQGKHRGEDTSTHHLAKGWAQALAAATAGNGCSHRPAGGWAPVRYLLLGRSTHAPRTAGREQGCTAPTGSRKGCRPGRIPLPIACWGGRGWGRVGQRRGVVN